MLFRILTSILGCLMAVQCRDIGKTFRSIPTITGSLVNLGKMDISFHFNSKETPLKMDSHAAPQHSFLLSKSEPIIEEPCPCSGLRGFRDGGMNHPAEMLNKILMSGDLFSFNKELTSSTLCCESHEHAQEDIVTFEFGPRDTEPLGPTHTVNPLPSIPKLPFIFDNFLPRRPSVVPNKMKNVEIFLFPKKKDGFPSMTKDFVKKDNIQVVGDKEYKNDYKPLKFRPSIPLNLQSSVKKDLTAQEKNETKKPTEIEDIELTTVGNPNSL